MRAEWQRQSTTCMQSAVISSGRQRLRMVVSPCTGTRLNSQSVHGLHIKTNTWTAANEAWQVTAGLLRAMEALGTCCRDRLNARRHM